MQILLAVAISIGLLCIVALVSLFDVLTELFESDLAGPAPASDLNPADARDQAIEGDAQSA